MIFMDRNLFLVNSLFLVIWFCPSVYPSYSQTVVMDTTMNKQVLIGKVNLSAFSDSAWFKDQDPLDSLGNVCKIQIDSFSQNINIKVYFGSWCSDSHHWLPYSVKLLGGTNLFNRVEFIGLPKDLIMRDSIAPEMSITRVPTFIFYRNEKEVGRIIENPEGHFASDLINILRSSIHSDKGN